MMDRLTGSLENETSTHAREAKLWLQSLLLGLSVQSISPIWLILKMRSPYAAGWCTEVCTYGELEKRLIGSLCLVMSDDGKTLYSKVGAIIKMQPFLLLSGRRWWYCMKMNRSDTITTQFVECLEGHTPPRQPGFSQLWKERLVLITYALTSWASIKSYKFASPAYRKKSLLL